jgi:Protein of unknown function (DUF3313)
MSNYLLKAIVLACLLMSGCATHTRMSVPIPNTFLEDVDITKKKENLPFDHAWSRPGVDWSSYKAIYIKPVRTDLLPLDNWKTSYSGFLSSKEEYVSEVRELGLFFYSKLLEHLRELKGGLTKIATAPGPEVLTLEIALTEVEFSHPAASAASLAAPMPATSQVLMVFTDPYVTFAARLTDGSSGLLLATAADRKFSPRRLVNLNRLTVASANREISELQAEALASTLSKGELVEIEETNWSLFTLW